MTEGAVADKDHLCTERCAAELVLAQKSAAFEAGFKNVRESLYLVRIPPSASAPQQLGKASGIVRTAEYRECCGEGRNTQEALDDWSAKLAQFPQSGDILCWRVRPDIDWDRSFNTRETVWKVYARFAIFETNEAAA